MASSSSQRMIHQDYIARIRYSNALPPPPNPPKLLDIPNTGLASGQYTTPGFASRLARDQPLNIEADAELGMPLDLVGMPGIFDGDESSIQAPINTPPVHPHDRALLRPLATLGKPKFSDSGVSFLRRTEYISSATSKSRFESTTSRSLMNNIGNRNNKRPIKDVDKESPEHIKSEVERSFQVAAQNLKNTNIRHPTKKNLKLVDSYPLLPDLHSFPDPGGYIIVKFLTNPVPPSSTYDKRLETSILVPLEPIEEEERAKQLARELHARDPTRYPAVEDAMEYEFFLTPTSSDASKFKRKFNPQDASDDNDALYTYKSKDTGEPCFRFQRIRAYETTTVSGSPAEKYEDEVVIALNDGSDGLHEKAAYYLPIVQKTAIRPQRTKNINSKKWSFTAGSGSAQAQEDELRRMRDFVDVKVLPPNEEMLAVRDAFKTQPYGPEEEEAEAEEEGSRDGHHDATAAGAAASSTP